MTTVPMPLDDMRGSSPSDPQPSVQIEAPMTADRAALATETPMSDHVARFYELLATEYVHIIVNIRREHDEGQPPHWDCASFGNDVAKALVRSPPPAPAADVNGDMLAALLTAPCPAGGWTGQPEDIFQATVKDCLAYGVCGCNLGDAARKATQTSGE